MAKQSGNGSLLNLQNSDKAYIFPIAANLEEAISSTQSLFIGAHEDDMLAAPYPILNSFYGREKCASVTLTDGGGAPTTELTTEEMVAVRLQEGKEAATRARLSLNVNLGYTSADAKSNRDKQEYIIADLMQIILFTKPKEIWTLAPTDEHPTHLVTGNLVVEALLRLKEKDSYICPKLYGVQIWGNDLDSIAKDSQAKRVEFALSRQELQDFKTILEAYSSQNSQHNYAEGTIARFTASSTFTGSHETKTTNAVAFAVDMTHLAQDRVHSPAEFAKAIMMEKVQKTLENHQRFSAPVTHDPRVGEHTRKVIDSRTSATPLIIAFNGSM